MPVPNNDSAKQHNKDNQYNIVTQYKYNDAGQQVKVIDTNIPTTDCATV